MELVHGVVPIVKSAFDELLVIGVLRICHEVGVVELDEVVQIHKLLEAPVALVLIFGLEVLVTLFDGRIYLVSDVIEPRNAMLNF